MGRRPLPTCAQVTAWGAVEDYNAAGLRVSLTTHAVGQHNQAVIAAVAATAVLRALDPGARPNSRQPVHIPANPITVPPLIVALNKTAEAQPGSVANQR
jgi:hypothetical protein